MMAVGDLGLAGQRLQLPGGRYLAYAEYGDPGGRVLFYFHGLPGSRLEGRLAATVAEGLGVRIIAVDRPGFGLSDFVPGRSLSDWPDDVAWLADALGLDTFSVIGVSGGGPYALVCGWKIPDRIGKIALVCGLGPLAVPALLDDMVIPLRPVVKAVRAAPRIGERVLGGIARYLMCPRPDWILALLSLRAQPPDRVVLRRPEVRAVLSASIREAGRQGGRGIGHDLYLFGRPWGFPLEAVETPVILWQGEQDGTVPVSHGRYMAAALPRCRAHFLAGEGHFSLPVGRMNNILGAMQDDEGA